jgi:hypothetical protein
MLRRHLSVVVIYLVGLLMGVWIGSSLSSVSAAPFAHHVILQLESHTHYMIFCRRFNRVEYTEGNSLIDAECDMTGIDPVNTPIRSFLPIAIKGAQD